MKLTPISKAVQMLDPHPLHAILSLSFTFGLYGYSELYSSRQFAENFQINDLPYVYPHLDKQIRLYTAIKSLYNRSRCTILLYRFYFDEEGERMYEMPTDLQYKDELRKERIRIEDELELLRDKEYEKLEKKLERDLSRVIEGIES